MERNAAKRLKGDVQSDHAYIGGSRPGTCGRGAAGKTPFVAAVSTTSDGKPDQIVLRRVARFSKTAIARFAVAMLDAGVHAVSDGFRSFAGVTEAGCTHSPVKTGSGAKAAKNPRLQMGQHHPWQHQGRNGWNLQSRARQTRAAIPRRIRIPLQPKIQARNHDRQARICLGEDSPYAVQAAEIG